MTILGGSRADTPVGDFIQVLAPALLASFGDKQVKTVSQCVPKEQNTELFKVFKGLKFRTILICPLRKKIITIFTILF